MKVPDVMTIKEALNLMRHEQVLRLSVVSSDGVLQGIISITDVVVDAETVSPGESAQTFSPPAEHEKRSYTLLESSAEAPRAFDENGYSPLERVFNESEAD